jgi:hypothetical protein
VTTLEKRIQWQEGQDSVLTKGAKTEVAPEKGHPTLGNFFFVTDSLSRLEEKMKPCLRGRVLRKENLVL